MVRSGDDPEGPVYAVLLRDVTDERRRQEDLKTFATEILRTHEEERRRLAQELHDETIQTLVLLRRKLNAVEQETGILPPTAEAALRDARASAEGVLRSLREFAHTLRPSVLDDLGLVASLRQLTHHASHWTGVPGRFRVDGAVRRLPAAVELGLFRIAQEAVRNVERHALASRFLVRLSFARGEVRLTVTDNRQGFTVPADGDLLAHRHLGLVSMRERAHLLGGSCEIRSVPTKGTAVHARIPVHDEELPRPAAAGGRRASRRREVRA